MQKNTSKTQNGFGLVEVLVSITIIVLVVVTFSELARFAFQNWESAKNKSVAYNLIQSTIEDLHDQRNINLNTEGNGWSYGIESVDPPETIPVGDKNYDIYTIVRDLGTPVTSNPNSRKKVTVTVKWTERAGKKSLTGITYLTDWKGKY